jgi:hypothetical protein
MYIVNTLHGREEMESGDKLPINNYLRRAQNLNTTLIMQSATAENINPQDMMVIGRLRSLQLVLFLVPVL